MDELIFNINIDGKRDEGCIKLKAGESILPINDIILNIKHDSSGIGIGIMNNSENKRILSALQIYISSLDISGYKAFLVNPESSNSETAFKKVNSLKNKKQEISFLYSLFEGCEDYKSQVIGFLSSHSSRNYIRIVRNNNKIDIFAVYDFVNQIIDKGERIILDNLYIESGNEIFKVFNDYSYSVKKNAEKLNVQNKLAKGFIKDNPFFIKNKAEGMILNRNRAVTAKADGKRLYLVDITEKEGKDIILSKCSIYKDTKEYVYIGSIMPYIERATKLKKFNVYREINKMLEAITAETGLKLMFDDCPEGIAVKTMDAVVGIMKMKNKDSTISKFMSRHKRENLNYNYIIRTIYRKGTFKNITSFDIENKRVKQAMEIMAMCADESNILDERLKNIIEDMDENKPVSVHIEDDELFAIMRYGRKSVYIAVFNFSNTARRLYIDFSLNLVDYPPDGMYFDVYSDGNYLISNGKIYIKSISPGDCCLIVKDSKRKKILNVV